MSRCPRCRTEGAYLGSGKPHEVECLNKDCSAYSASWAADKTRASVPKAKPARTKGDPLEEERQIKRLLRSMTHDPEPMD